MVGADRRRLNVAQRRTPSGRGLIIPMGSRASRFQYMDLMLRSSLRTERTVFCRKKTLNLPPPSRVGTGLYLSWTCIYLLHILTSLLRLPRIFLLVLHYFCLVL
jgi:hypothetical protein